jgi:hypothetical protein
LAILISDFGEGFYGAILISDFSWVVVTGQFETHFMHLKNNLKLL